MNPNSISYTDLNAMTALKAGSNANSQENIRRVAEQFESLFLNMMVKSMRDANAVFAEGNPLNTPQTRFYQDMYDNQMSVHLAEKQGVGLSEVLMRQLSPNADRAPAALSVESPEASGPQDHSARLARRRLAFALGSSAYTGIAASTAPAAAPTGPAGAVEMQPLRALQAALRQSPVERDTNPMLNARAPAVASGEPLPRSGQSRFNSPQEFVSTMLPMAEKAAARLGVDPHYLVAQAALETGWGKSVIRQSDGSSSHNLFGIKSHGGWQGDSATVMTHEYREGVRMNERASFRSYESYEQSFEDYVDFLQGNRRYQQALGSTSNPDSFFRELQQAGYATDPQYARKISQIARQLLSNSNNNVASQTDAPAAQGRV